MTNDNLNVSLLNYISDEELKSFKYKPEIKEFKKGEIVFRVQESPDYMYIIKEGFIKISMFLTDGREQVLYVYGKGDFVGAHNLLSKENYVYEGTSLGDCKVIFIHKEDFDNVLKNNNNILIKLLDQSFKRIRSSEELIDRLAGLNADVKVAKLLLDMANIYGIEKDEGILIKSHMNREELGSYSGVVRETLSRKLSYFEALNLIELLPRGEILIKNKKALEKITN